MGTENEWLEKYHSMPVPESNPCIGCRLAETCHSVCPARARWWDRCVLGELPPPKKLRAAAQLWSVQNRESGEWVVENRSSEECAQAIGVSASYLAHVYRNQKDGKLHHMWYIEKRSRNDPAVPHSDAAGRYTVYDNKIDKMVCLDASAAEAATAMGCKSMNSFYSMISKSKAGKNKRWHVEIIKEE